MAFSVERPPHEPGPWDAVDVGGERDRPSQGDAALPGDRDPATAARQIIDANAYMTLATVAADGLPWATPVWFAHRDHVEFFWISRPQARHSRNLAARRDVAIVIFDSSVPVGGAQAVYLEAEAQELDGAERDRAVEVYSRRSIEHGAGPLTSADVSAPAPHRFYHAIATTHFVLGPGDQRVAAPI
jgi:uncharacterized protein YhbP (UPF0306 family)